MFLKVYIDCQTISPQFTKEILKKIDEYNYNKVLYNLYYIQ